MFCVALMWDLHWTPARFKIRKQTKQTQFIGAIGSFHGLKILILQSFLQALCFVVFQG